jgi:hypothetical protein
MNLYLLTQTVNDGISAYDSCVVAAKNIQEAKKIHPNEYFLFEWSDEHDCWVFNYNDGRKGLQDFHEWPHPEFVKAKLIGVAKNGIKEGAICASFNA